MERRPYNLLTPVPFEQVEILNGFWSKRQKINREISIHLQHQLLEGNHHIDNFKITSGIKKGITRGLFYLDSDLYKWLEAASYILHLYEDSELEGKVNEIIDLIIKSQTSDGYVNTYFTTKFPLKRLTNLHVPHELYCAGHLFQAAIANYISKGDKRLLNVAKKYANLLVKTFLERGRKGAPGHEEIEMALIELFRITKNRKYLELAELFINRRGNISIFMGYALYKYLDTAIILRKTNKIEYKYEQAHPKETKKKDSPPEYAAKLSIKDSLRLFFSNSSGSIYQLDRPVRKIFKPVGHAVRAMYLYCGMADLYSETGDKEILKALELVWIKMVKARIYITGGIGSIKAIEGFGPDFKLDPEKSYSETCAAIGNMMWNWRMLQITGKAKYADLIEKLMYNAFLVGQSIDGKAYTYSNPLVSRGKEKRQEWFICACCPPNVARTIASIGKYIYSTSDEGVWIHQYIGNKATLTWRNIEILIIMETKFPWESDVKIELNPKSNCNISFFLRIPSWTNDAELLINEQRYQGQITPSNYVKIIKNWQKGDIIHLTLNSDPYFVHEDPRVKNTRYHGAINFGPFIYCLEQRDNDFDIFKEKFPKDPEFTIGLKPDLLGGIKIIQGFTCSGNKFKAIPYYAWCNRGANKMQIWNKMEP